MLALLHTSPVHVPTFTALRETEAPGLPLRHAVREDLLADARREGPEAVADRVRRALTDVAGDDARAVLCTCSTIGAVAERAAIGVPVLRVDRPMAAAAVASGGPVAVLAALASTLDPTLALIAEEAAPAGRTPRVTAHEADGAWALFEAGDTAGYERAVAAAIDSVEVVDPAAVIVLAQASMAPAARLARTGVPVLSSPRLGLRAAADLTHGEPNRSRKGTKS